MKIRRLAALVSAAVLALGMVTAVSATEQPPICDPAADVELQWECEPCNPEGQQDGQCPETTEAPSVEPTKAATVEPEEDGQVEGLTSEPTLPPTDALTSTGTSGPDDTLPLVLIVLGVIGLAAVVLTPARARR